jgi:hypothetical protein
MDQDAPQQGKHAVRPEKKVNVPTSHSKPRALSRDELAKLPRLQKDGLHYLGGLRLPGGKQGASEFAYGGTALAFNPSGPSLLVVGHDWHQAVAEVSIPDNLVKSKRSQDLPVASCLQPFASLITRVPKNTLEGNVKVGGLLVVEGKLIGSLYGYYDAEGKARDSHFRLASLDLPSAQVGGLYQVGDLGGGFTGGYMAEVPPEWREALGSSYVTGQAALNIISRTSSGPALFGFDPADLGSKSVAPIKPYVYYPLSHPLGKIDEKGPYFNGNTEIKGVCFAPETCSVLFFGSHGTGDVYYGEAVGARDRNRVAKGWHSVGGQYQYQVWAYDANDFVAIKIGKVKPWEIKPYAVWKLELPIDEGSKHLGGVAFDAENNRLYVSQLHADEWARPLIHVFELSTK